MGSSREKWFREENFKKWFRKDNLIILILSGVLLFVIALPTGKSGGTDSGLVTADFTDQALTKQDSASLAEEEYTAQLEERLRETLSKMEGVGQVKVMITLKSSQELVVQKEQPYSRSSTTESDTQGGSRTISQIEMEDQTVYRTSGSDSEPYVIKTLPPEIQGVVVVAEGAGNGTVNRTIVEMVQALFDVEAHKVRVVKMETVE